MGLAALESCEEGLSIPKIFPCSDEEVLPGLTDCGTLDPDMPVDLPPEGFRVPESSDPPPAAVPLTEGSLDEADFLQQSLVVICVH